MASVTDIRSITNSLFYPISIINGENSGQMFSIDQGGTWNGELWVPWVGREDEMYKCIAITCLDLNLSIRIFQDYWYPAGADAIKYVLGSGGYSQGQEIEGNNRGGGRKILMVNHAGKLSMQ